jgi:hypothetical protein
MGHVTADALNTQAASYESEGLPAGEIAPETRVLYRKRNSRTEAFNCAWWNELDNRTIRDQVSFAYARWVSGATLDLLPRHIFQKPLEGNFTAVPHRPRIYYFSPFDRRGLGWAYNSCCSIVPSDDCWICCLDFDVMLFPSSIGILIENVISKHGAYYDYFTCLTNRVLANWMCVGGKISGERDLVNLYKLAMDRIDQHGTNVSKWEQGFAGYFMLFRKKLWREIPFPTVATAGEKQCRVLGIDTEWYRRLKAAGKRIGCIDGLTAVHYYRMAEQHADHRHMLEHPHDFTRPEPEREPTKVIVTTDKQQGKVRPFRGRVRQ